MKKVTYRTETGIKGLFTLVHTFEYENKEERISHYEKKVDFLTKELEKDKKEMKNAKGRKKADLKFFIKQTKDELAFYKAEIEYFKALA